MKNIDRPALFPSPPSPTSSPSSSSSSSSSRPTSRPSSSPPLSSKWEKYFKWPRDIFCQPFSTQYEPFTQWNGLPFSFVTDGFCHEKLLNAKLKSTNSKSLIKISQSVVAYKSNYQFKDQVKLWFDINNYGSLYTKIKSSQYIKLYYTHNLKKFKTNDYYYYFLGACANKATNNADLRASFSYLSDTTHIQNRLKFGIKQNLDITWYLKAYHIKNKLRLGWMSVFNLNNLVLRKTSLLIGYQFNPQLIAFLRTDVNGFRQKNFQLKKPTTIADKAILDLIYKKNNNHKFAFQTSYLINKQDFGDAKIVYEYSHTPKTSFKLYITRMLGFACVVKTPIKYGLDDIATVSLGFGVDNAKNAKIQNISKGIQINFGI